MAEAGRAWELRRERGRELKAQRRAAGLSQPQLASRTTDGRAAIAALGSAAVTRLGRLVPVITRRMRRRPRLVVPGALEECGFGVIDWRALPRRVTVELLRAADRIARDGHAVAFTGHRYRAGPELSIDGRLTVTRHLSGQPGPAATPDPAGELLIATLTDLAGLPGGAQHIAVVSGQPEFSKQDAAEAVTRWQRSRRCTGGRGSVDVYGHDWTLHL